jgi:hypothetical protein
MSTYLDTRSGKWFKTRAELLAFQRGEAPVSPRSVSAERNEKVEPEVETTKENEEQTTQEEAAGDSSDDEFERMIREALLVPVDQIKTELKEEFLVDGRRLRWADEEDLKQLYLEKLKQRWMRNR